MTEPATHSPGSPIIAAIVVAAGRGTRARREGDAGPKQYIELGGQAILARTMAALAAHPSISMIRAVIHTDDDDIYRSTTTPHDKYLEPAIGGATRQDSVRMGLMSMAGNPPDIVLIHDGVRPFVSGATIDRLIAEVGHSNAAIAALPVADTLKRTGGDGRIEATVNRDHLWAAQTPQAFRYGTILFAHQDVGARGVTGLTDDAAVAETLGETVTVVLGNPENFKITRPEDIDRAERMLQEQSMPTTLPDLRVGTGYDVHAFTSGDHVMLGGVRIPHDQALSGHSDADVVLHAATDALFGAIGDSDIGSHFPPTDPQWRGAASHLFLEKAVSDVAELGGRINHLDITVICERPKVGPYRDEIRQSVSRICNLPTSRVSIKATTTERLGFTGRGEGIAAMATATIALPHQYETE